MITNIPEPLLFRILKYFQTHKFHNYINKTTNIEKYKIRINNGIKTDINTIINISKINSKINDFITKSDYFKLFWIVYYNSLCTIEKDCIHLSQCKTRDCKNISHYINKKNNKNFKNIFKNINKIIKNETKISEQLYYI